MKLGLLVLVIAAAAIAARPNTAATVFNSLRTIDALIEQQSDAFLDAWRAAGNSGVAPNYACTPPGTSFGGLYPVCNTAGPGYLWDVDDNSDWAGTADLLAGESIVMTQPLVLDSQTHLLYVKGGSRSGAVAVTMSIPEIGWSVVVPADTVVCYLTPSYNDATLPEIAGSNGGHGIRGTVTWTLTATKRAKAAGLSGKVRYASLGVQAGIGCPVVPAPVLVP